MTGALQSRVPDQQLRTKTYWTKEIRCENVVNSLAMRIFDEIITDMYTGIGISSDLVQYARVWLLSNHAGLNDPG